MAPSKGKSQSRRLARHAATCAAKVLPLFEKENPTDPRPRQAIAAARAWASGKLSIPAARKAAFAAHAAARIAKSTGAKLAARSAGHAAATAHVPTHAPHAITYAKKSAIAANFSLILPPSPHPK